MGAWLSAHKIYPQEARRRGEHGRVVVRFEVDASGQVLDVELVEGSGSARLDEAAQTMLRGEHVPPFAPNMSQTPVTIMVTLLYALDP